MIHPAADALLFLSSAIVVSVFLWRFMRRRRIASLGAASVSLGWVVAALEDAHALTDKALGLCLAIGCLCTTFFLSSAAYLEMRRLRTFEKGEDPMDGPGDN